jgi:hypothetical protein
MKIINSNECLRNQLVKYPLIEQLLYQELTSVKSLMELSRLKIRKCLDQRLISKVNILSLPQKLKDYVAMREIFAYSNTTSSNNNIKISNNKNDIDDTNYEIDDNFQIVEINKNNYLSILSHEKNTSNCLKNENNNKNEYFKIMNINQNLNHSNISSFSSTSSDTSSFSLPSKSSVSSSIINDSTIKKNNVKKKSLFKEASKKFRREQ